MQLRTAKPAKSVKNNVFHLGFGDPTGQERDGWVKPVEIELFISFSYNYAVTQKTERIRKNILKQGFLEKFIEFQKFIDLRARAPAAGTPCNANTRISCSCPNDSRTPLGTTLHIPMRGTLGGTLGGSKRFSESDDYIFDNRPAGAFSKTSR